MGTQFIFYNDVTAGNRIVSGFNDTDVVIGSGATFGSNDASAILLTGSDHDVFVRGTLVGDVIGVQLGDGYNNDSGTTSAWPRAGRSWGIWASAPTARPA